MSWQNWVVSWLARNRIKKPTERQPLFDPIATRINAEKRSMPTPVRLPPDWRIVQADGALPGEWIEPADPDALGDAPPVVFYLHGGGYFFCSPRTHRSITIGLAVHAQARVFALDYRLAPEHPFPAAVHDALAGYRALLAQRIAPSRIVVAGIRRAAGCRWRCWWPCAMPGIRCRPARSCIRRGPISPPPVQAWSRTMLPT